MKLCPRSIYSDVSVTLRSRVEKTSSEMWAVLCLEEAVSLTIVDQSKYGANNEVGAKVQREYLDQIDQRLNGKLFVNKRHKINPGGWW